MFGITGKKSVLIIEDDAYTLDIYTTAFTEGGFEVTARTDADGTFAETVVEVNPDIISMDIMIGKSGKLTERDGIEALGILKADLRTHEIPVFIVSNFFQEDRVRQTRELGAVDYLNATGISPKQIVDRFTMYLDDPDNYKPMHPIFREPLEGG